MDEILRLIMADDGFNQFKEQGFIVDEHKETPMRINYSFYEDLSNNKIMDLGEFDERIEIYHGTIDDTAPYKDVVEFANKNPNTTLHSLENENHKYTIPVLLQFSQEVANLIYQH